MRQCISSATVSRSVPNCIARDARRNVCLAQSPIGLNPARRTIYRSGLLRIINTGFPGVSY